MLCHVAWGGWLWAGVLGVALAIQQAGPPPLPDLALERFPPASREALARVLTQARLAPDDAAAVGALAMTLQAWEQWEAAHAAYQRARALGGARDALPRWAYLDGVVLQRLGRTDDAVTALGETVTADDGYLPARVKLADVLFESGRVEESGALWRALVKEPAAEPIAELGLGRIAADAGRHDDAVRHLSRAIALFPEFGAAHYQLARALRAQGRTDEAQQALARHKAFGPRWPAVADPVLAEVAALRDDARASLQRGMKLAEAGDVEGAIAAHEAAVARDASSAQAHVELIVLYGRVRNWTKAEEHYRAAVALNRDLEEAHYNYGVLLAHQERWPEAAAAYTRALAINPRNPLALNNLGQAQEHARDVEQAAASYRRAVEASPTFRLARFNLGRMLMAQGRAREAIAELARLTEPRDAEAPRYLYALAAAHIRAGQKDEGIKWATEARTLALAHGQTDLAAAIERDIAALNAPAPPR